MNNNLLRVGGLGLLLLAAVLIYSAAFTVHQTQHALVFQFGRITRPPISQPGLYFKWPLLDQVVTLDKRLLDLDLPAQEVIASDQKRLVVDAFARYRIAQPLRFYQSANNIVNANQQLTIFVTSSVRAILADATFQGVVRTDRTGLMQRIRNDVNAQAANLGVEVVDVRLRRADLPEQNSQAVFQRMQTERQREAADIRAQGTQLGQSIRARADRDVTVIVAEANRRADEARGVGDAERNRIFAEAYGQDPDFFAFYRSMQAYETGLKANDTRMVLAPDSDFFRYFNDPRGRRNASGAFTSGGRAGAPAPAPGSQRPGPGAQGLPALPPQAGAPQAAPPAPASQ